MSVVETLVERPFGPEIAVEHRTEEAEEMDGLADDLNTLSLLARIGVSRSSDASADQEVRFLIDGLKDERLKPLAEAIVRGDSGEPVARQFIEWASVIRRASNGSQAKRQKLLRESERLPVGSSVHTGSYAI